MRRLTSLVWLVAIAGGCTKAGGGSTGPLVPLDPTGNGVVAEPEPAKVTPTPGEVALPDADVPELVGGAPASAPRGAPVAISFRAPKVGSVRTRTQKSTLLYAHDFEHEGERVSRRQITRNVFELREEVRAVDAGKVAKVRASVIDARESITLDGKVHGMPLLQGTYEVDVAGGVQMHGRMNATHESGREVGSRELEELGALFALDAGNETTLVALVRKRPLRLGEAIVLDDEAEQILLGQAIPEALTLSLVEVTKGQATFQLDMGATQGTETRAGRQRMTIDVATGRLVAMTLELASSKRDGADLDEQRSRTVVTFASTAW